MLNTDANLTFFWLFLLQYSIFRTCLLFYLFLQEKYFSIQFDRAIFEYNRDGYTFSMPGTQGLEADVTFDLPEDIPLIKNIECSFEERIKQ